METDLEIDIDMDIDPGPFEYDMPLDDEKVQQRSQTPPVPSPLPQIDASQLAPTKVHLRGLDNLTSSDVKAFASSYFSTEPTIEWINDMSANLIYETPAIALEALAAFTGANIGDLPQLPLLQMLPTRTFPEHPDVRLEARIATLGDRKEAGARDRSRFYLFNPQYDPAERRKRESYGRRGQGYRDPDDSSYRRRENRQEFDASLYDDDEISRAVRASRQSNGRNSKTNSSGEYGGHGIRKVRFSGGAVKELFPDRLASLNRAGGRLRNRSASPLRADNSEGDMSDSQWKSPDHRAGFASSGSMANRRQAQVIKEELNQTSSKPRELFPQKVAISHKRSDAFDATDATTELFANRMSVPFLDDDSVPTKHHSMSGTTRSTLESRISSVDNTSQNGFKIRGAAKLSQSGEISIKGIASMAGIPARELFPSKMGTNSGKELFSGKLEGRGRMRQRAEDMFY